MLLETALCINDRIAELSVFYSKRLSIYKEILISPTSQANLMYQYLQDSSVWDINNCVMFYGKLTFLKIKKNWQSDNLPKL